MSHPNQPMFYTLTSINSFDGSTSLIGIFDSMRALGYRLQRVYSTCGDEYHIDCLHLQDAESEAKMLTEEQVNRVKYQREEKIKDQLLKEHQEKSSNDDEQLADQIREERLNVA